MNVEESMKRFNVPGVGVCRFEDGSILGEEHYGVLENGKAPRIAKDTIFHACSISKLVTALCIVRLAQDGAVDLQGEANRYLKSWRIPDTELTATRKVRIADILAHQGGFLDVDGSFEPYRADDTIPMAVDLLKGTTRYSPVEVRPSYVPGSRFEYSDAGYCVIEQLLLDTTGETIGATAERLVFKPLGLTHSFFWGPGDETRLFGNDRDCGDCASGHHKNGEVVEGMRACYPNPGGAGLWSTPSELATIVMDMLDSYTGEGGIVLSQVMAKTMLAPYGCESAAGLGLFLDDDKGEPFFFSQGWGVGMQCKLRAYTTRRRGVVVMTNSDPGLHQDKSLVGEIIESACGDR